MIVILIILYIVFCCAVIYVVMSFVLSYIETIHKIDEIHKKLGLNEEGNSKTIKTHKS